VDEDYEGFGLSGELAAILLKEGVIGASRWLKSR